eukprot:4152831-Pleurochrysis_carterae.AAC.3
MLCEVWHLQHFGDDEGVESVGVIGGRQRRDAIGVAGAQQQVIARGEHRALALPAHGVPLEHVDDTEKVHLLLVERDVAALRRQVGKPCAARRAVQRLRQPVDPDKERKACVRGDHLAEARLVGLGHVDDHGNVEPFPIAQRAVRAATALLRLRVHRVQKLGRQSAPVRRGAFQIKGEPRTRRHKVSHHDKVDLARELPAQLHRVAAKVLDERPAAPTLDVGEVGGQHGHERALLALGDLLDDEARRRARGVATRGGEHAVEKGARGAFRHALFKPLTPARPKLGQIVREGVRVHGRRDAEALPDRAESVDFVVQRS